DGGQVGRRFRQADLREAVEEALQREGDLHAGEGGTEAEVHPVAEGHVVLDRAGRVEGVGVVVPVGMPVGGRVGGEYGLPAGDGPPVGQRDVGDREPQRQVLDGGFVTQGLLDDVVPGDRALADEVELPGPGQQGEHRLVYDVDRGLVPGADHQQQGVAQLVVGEPGAVALVVAGRDQQG